MPTPNFRLSGEVTFFEKMHNKRSPNRDPGQDLYRQFKTVKALESAYEFEIEIVESTPLDFEVKKVILRSQLVESEREAKRAFRVQRCL